MPCSNSSHVGTSHGHPAAMAGMEGAWLGDPLKFLGWGGGGGAAPGRGEAEPGRGRLRGGGGSGGRSRDAHGTGERGAAGRVPGLGPVGAGRGLGVGLQRDPPGAATSFPSGSRRGPGLRSRSGRRRGRSGQCWGRGRLRSPGSDLGAPSAGSRPQGSPAPGTGLDARSRSPRRTKVLPQGRHRGSSSLLPAGDGAGSGAHRGSRGEQHRGTAGPRALGKDRCPQSGMGTCWPQERISGGLWARQPRVAARRGRDAGGVVLKTRELLLPPAMQPIWRAPAFALPANSEFHSWFSLLVCGLDQEFGWMVLPLAGYLQGWAEAKMPEGEVSSGQEEMGRTMSPSCQLGMWASPA